MAKTVKPTGHRRPRSAATRTVHPAEDEGQTGRRLGVLIGNGKVKDTTGGYALDIDGIDRDLESLGGILGDAETAGFEIRALLEPTLIDVRREIARAAKEVGPDDTLLVYYSGTSTLGKEGSLYLPVIDSVSTISKLRASIVTTCCPVFVAATAGARPCSWTVATAERSSSTTAGSQMASARSCGAGRTNTATATTREGLYPVRSRRSAWRRCGPRWRRHRHD